MSDTLRRQASHRQRRAAEQAASWYLDQCEGLDDAQRARFMDWLRQSPLHVQEYLAMARLHGDLAAAAALDPLREPELCELAASEHAVIPLRMSKQAVAAIPAPSRRRRAWAWISHAAAAIVVVAVGMAAWMARAPDHWMTYASGPAELRSIALSDGTQVQLDRDSVLAVRFDARQRSFNVLRGGALFDVGHDAKRPLRVMLGANVLEDIGTVFDAHRSADGGNVTVVSGRVKVWQQQPDAWTLASRASDGPLVADLGAGQQASMHRDGSLDLVDRHADIGRHTAWLPADIHFERATVADVARQFNAYSSQPLRIDDATIAATRISGRFHARDMEAFIAYLGTLPGVQIVRDADDIRVRGATRGKRGVRTL